MEDIVRLARLVTNEDKRFGHAVGDEKGGLRRHRRTGRAYRRKRHVRRDIDGWERFAEANPDRQHGHPGGRKRKFASALDRGPNRKTHPTPLVCMGRTNDPPPTAPPPAGRDTALRFTLERQTAYCAACTSTTS